MKQPWAAMLSDVSQMRQQAVTISTLAYAEFYIGLQQISLKYMTPINCHQFHLRGLSVNPWRHMTAMLSPPEWLNAGEVQWPRGRMEDIFIVLVKNTKLEGRKTFWRIWSTFFIPNDWLSLCYSLLFIIYRPIFWPTYSTFYCHSVCIFDLFQVWFADFLQAFHLNNFPPGVNLVLYLWHRKHLQVTRDGNDTVGIQPCTTRAS